MTVHLSDCTYTGNYTVKEASTRVLLLTFENEIVKYLIDMFDLIVFLMECLITRTTTTIHTHTHTDNNICKYHSVAFVL